MFPLNFNFPFRKSNGELTTLGRMFENSGGGGSYTLPTASASTKGGIKIGSGLTMDGETLNNDNPTPYDDSEITEDIEEVKQDIVTLSTNSTKLVNLSTSTSIFNVLNDRSLYPINNVYWSTAEKLTNGNDTFSSLLSIHGNSIVRIEVYSEWYMGIEINDASHGTALIAWANKTTTQLKFIQINPSTSPYVSQVTLDKAT